MRIPFSLLFAVVLCYYSCSALNWAWSLHADPWRAEDFATEEAAAKGIDWPLERSIELAGKHYRSTFTANDGTGRFAMIEVKKTETGWQLVSFKEGQAEWRKRVTASR